MCGRFEIHSTIEIIARIFQVDSITFTITPSYNIAPSQDIAIIINDGKNRLIPSRWGFVPAWSKELKTGYATINARAETVATSRSFSSSFENHRCLVPADGFYEWKKEGTDKRPYYIRLLSGQPMGFAGLYHIWTSPAGEEICTCTIITTDANELLGPIHPRLPVILPEQERRFWLDPAQHDRERLLQMLKPLPSRELECYAVTSRVNSFKYNALDNIQPVVIKTVEKKPEKSRKAGIRSMET
jgi:putative SOS response-associated peptidase YedK